MCLERAIRPRGLCLANYPVRQGQGSWGKEKEISKSFLEESEFQKYILSACGIRVLGIAPPTGPCPGAWSSPLSKRSVSVTLQTAAPSRQRGSQRHPVLWAGPGWAAPLALRPASHRPAEWLAFLSGVSPVEAGKVCRAAGPTRKAL